MRNGIRREMGEAEVAAFLNDLAGPRGVAAATQNQALNALLFLFEVVLERKLRRTQWTASPRSGAASEGLLHRSAYS